MLTSAQVRCFSSKVLWVFLSELPKLVHWLYGIKVRLQSTRLETRIQEFVVCVKLENR